MCKKLLQDGHLNAISIAIIFAHMTELTIEAFPRPGHEYWR